MVFWGMQVLLIKTSDAGSISGEMLYIIMWWRVIYMYIPLRIRGGACAGPRMNDPLTSWHTPPNNTWSFGTWLRSILPPAALEKRLFWDDAYRDPYWRDRALLCECMEKRELDLESEVEPFLREEKRRGRHDWPRAIDVPRKPLIRPHSAVGSRDEAYMTWLHKPCTYDHEKGRC